MAKVDGFISLIANDKYENAFPIIVAEAKFLMDNGYEIYSIKNERISAEEADNYFVILDGQHRCCAFARLVAADENMTFRMFTSETQKISVLIWLTSMKQAQVGTIRTE